MLEQQSVEYASSMEQITALVKAKVPYIWIITHEEKRFTDNFYIEIAEKQKKELLTWSSYSGITKYDPEEKIAKRATGDAAGTWSPNKALEYISTCPVPSNKSGSIFLMKDFHTVLQQPIPRQMRDMYETLINLNKTMIVISPCISHGPHGRSPGMEPTLDKQIVVVDYELPDRDSIKTRLVDTIDTIKDDAKDKKIETQLDYTDQEYHTFSTALQGLTEIEIDNALFTSISHLKRVDEKKLLLEKKQIIKKSQILEYIGHAPSMKEVGGLDEAKKYFEMYQDQFTPAAREFGVEPLRGVLLTGVPGTGKSLLAKAISAQWNLPLLRLDVGKVMTGLVGGSEQKMREVINQAESIAPCVTGDTMIQIDQGEFPIEQLYNQATYPIKIETIDPETGEVIDNWINTILRRSAEDKELLEITTESGKTIKVTTLHKLLVSSPNGPIWKEAKDLTEDDDLLEVD